jgi:hypothetical protein
MIFGCVKFRFCGINQDLTNSLLKETVCKASNIIDFIGEIRRQMRNGFRPWIRALGVIDDEKNRGSKISCHCPFKLRWIFIKRDKLWSKTNTGTVLLVLPYPVCHHPFPLPSHSLQTIYWRFMCDTLAVNKKKLGRKYLKSSSRY